MVVYMRAGYDQTWLDTDDLNIIPFYASHADRFGGM